MSASSEEPIAIIGMGCRFPGGVETPSGLWQLAAEGRQTAGPVPAGRWNATRLAAIHDPELAAPASIGCFLQGDVWAWEPEAFAVAPAEREWIDPQSRVMLEVAWEAAEHAGVPVSRMRGSRTGVYIGTYAPDNLFREARPVEDAPNSAYLFGNYTASTAGRVAFAMDLRGPVMVVSTHCSSSLVAIDTACGALTLGECDMAVAGGVLLMLAPQTQYFEAPLLLSKQGACHAFDVRADGYVRGEGAGAVLLKRLGDARRDGDRVLAVIRGSTVNNDGQSTRLTAPSTQMQQRLFTEAVRKARIDPGEVGLVEAHGPGTSVGDPIEYTSIHAIYGPGRGRCALGSIKTNIGHSEPASGVAGLIKAVECLRRGEIPPNQNFEAWNPGIDRDETSRLFVPTELTSWPVPGRTRLAAVCSYGVSGTNAHMVLEYPPAERKGARGRRPSPGGDRLFLLSGNSPQSAASAALRLADWLEGEGSQAQSGDIAHTLALRRHHADHRVGIVARDMNQLAARARAYASGEEAAGVVSGVPVLQPDGPGPVFVFTGQGSQYPGMCRELLAGEPAFAAAVAELEPLIRAESGFSLRQMIQEPASLSGVDKIQPALFGVQVALAALWRSWGVEPAAVIGQSLGEVAAATVAGALSPADGAKIICRRAALLARIAHGAMASVMLSAAETQAAIEASGADGVSLGVLTAPQTTVISGDAAQVRALVDGWNAADIVARMVDVDVASHSAQVDPIIEELHAVLADLPASQPEAPGRPVFYSTVSDNPADSGPLDATYWVRNQRETVYFQRAVTAALGDGHRLFIECTAHPLASRPIQDTAAAAGIRDVVAVGSLRRGTADQEAFLSHLAQVHAAGHEGIDFASRYGTGCLADVPATGWHRTRYGGSSSPYALIAPELPAASQHPLLGSHTRDPENPDRHLWQAPISPRRLPWLADHRVAGTPVLPGTGFAEMTLAAAAEVFGTRRVALTGLRVEAPLVLEPEPEVTTRLLCEAGQARAEILTRTDDGIVVHARATVRPVPEGETRPDLDPAMLPSQEWADSDPADLHRHFRDRHNVFHGPAFAAIDRIQLRPGHGGAAARLRVADSARVSAWMMMLHPALADEFVQTAVAAWLDYCATSPGPVVVVGFDEIRVHHPTAAARLAGVELHHADDLACSASGVLAADDGTVVAEIRGLRLANITPAEQRYASRLAHVDWVQEALPAPEDRAADGRWLVLGPQRALQARSLAEMLGSRSAGARLLSYPAGKPPEPGLITEVLGDGSGPPTHVLVVLEDPGEKGGDADAPANSRASVRLVLSVLQQLAECVPPPRLWVLWRGDSVLTAAGIRGLLRASAFEHPELRPSSVEVSGSTPLGSVLQDLLAENAAVTEIAWRHGVRSVARIRSGVPSRTVSARQSGKIRTDGSYLISGGLGGLGLVTARRLADRGALRIVLCSRSAASQNAVRELEHLRAATSTDVATVQGDIADPGTISQALQAATSGNVPLRGIVHAAGVVEDATLMNVSDKLFERVWRGKAEGAWALHQATVDTDLDFFAVYSSIASLIGSPGQGAYAAANAFCDALVAYRLAQGLPATGIHWGAWSQVGRGQHLGQQGLVLISPEDGMDAFERILADGHHQVAYSPIDVEQWTGPYPALRSSTLLAEMLTGTPEAESQANPVRSEVLAAADAAERNRILEDFVISQIRELLGDTTRHIGPHTSLVLLGLDSLGAVQLQQRLQNALKVNIKQGVIWVKPSAAGLAAWLEEQLRPHAAAA